MGVLRKTFLIGGAGRIARIWPKVLVPDHAEEVFEVRPQPLIPGKH